MLHRTDDYEVVLRGPAGEVVDRRPVTDFQAIYEDLRLGAALRGVLPNDGRREPGALSAVRRDGRVTGVAASLGVYGAWYGLQCFRYATWDLLQAHNLLTEEAREASPHSVELHVRAVERPPRLKAAVRGRPYPFDTGPLAKFGIDAPAPPHETSLFVRAGLLAELEEVTRQNPERERMHLLYGRLVALPEAALAVVLTGRREVRDAKGSSVAHFAIGPEAFLEAARAAERDGDVVCGWHHNHPARLAEEGRGAAKEADGSAFLSVDDHKVFRTWFRAPYFAGLVTGWRDGAAGASPVTKAYGWRSALVEEVPFRVF